jgi:hypothetical protein
MCKSLDHLSIMQGKHSKRLDDEASEREVGEDIHVEFGQQISWNQTKLRTSQFGEGRGAL